MMRTKFFYSSLVAAAAIFLVSFQKGKGKEPWNEKQLMPPAELAAKLSSTNASKVVVLNIGPAGAIKGSIEIGATQEEENLAAMKKELSGMSRDAEVVIYCGCCPFQNCPNIRPAFELLNEMKFENARLLNLPRNLGVDWIKKGYPMKQ